MKRTLIFICTFCLLLSGCSGILDGRYVSVESHPIETVESEDNASVSNYAGLLTVLQDMVAEGTESGIISVARYDQKNVGPHMEDAVDHILHQDPIGSYAVSEITYELGTSAGQNAVSVTISYVRDRTEIKKIQYPKDREQAEATIINALNSFENSVVLYVQDYEETDFVQWVAAYAAANPDKVMELPEVTANLYPESGSTRVVELKFAYQNTKDSLLAMQETVSRIFAAAVMYTGNEGQQQDLYYSLYVLLMGRSHSFQIETSITPAYSLLQHGVGDSRAFATVYAAMSTRTGLECYTVTGTRSGEPHYWNIICCDGVYYHLDLLESYEKDRFTLRLDDEMNGYVWDYSAYPVCNGQPAPDPAAE